MRTTSATQTFDQRFPPQVILDDDAAEAVWNLLHNEYCRFFNPEKSMPRDHLRAYHYLTDALGEHEQEQRRKEQERLPEKLERQAKQKQERAEKR